MRAFLRQWLLLHRAAQGAHRLYVPPDSFLRLVGDDRPDVDRQPAGPPDAQLPERPLQHRQRPVRHILLQAEDAQRRTALPRARTEEHTSELQSLMRISYAVFCLKNKTH